MSDINILDNLNYDEILQQMIAKLPSEISLLESDPAMKILEIAAFREMILRERINNAAKANLLAFATGNDLDYLAEFYGIIRNSSEIDDQFRIRAKAKIAAFATSGSKDHYRFHALSSSNRVKDALASSSTQPGVVKISILSNESSDGKATDELLKIVENHIKKDDIKMLTDTIEIVSCKIIPTDIKVEIKTANSLGLEEMREKFIKKFIDSASLGWSPTISWIIANLFDDTVTNIKVVLPQEDLKINSDECVSLNSLEFI